ncbi:MAG: RagB/SusD family nutrient uptake outer membrane protein, partial [Bacteroidetes bacterium]
MKFLVFQKSLLLTAGLALVLTSCFNDLDTVPLDEDILTADVVFDDPTNYKRALAKLYASYAVTGQQGPAGQGDISGIDEGFGSYLRMLFYHQELTTDEALVGWNDATIKDFHNQSWTSQDGFIFAMYSRIYYTISACNEFLRETTEDKIAARGQDSEVQAEVAAYRAEARLLRALAYYHALDMFRNVILVTEQDEVGAFLPDQINADELFAWLETELLALSEELAPAGANEYGRADQAAAWMLLAKLYLNAEVYIGQDRYSDAAKFSKRVIDSGVYQLEEVYQHNFNADNHLSKEIIFPITFDGERTQTFGGTTFIINASVGGSMLPAAYGIQGGWSGLRTTSDFVEKFPEVGGVVVEPVFDSGENVVLNVPGAYQGWNPEDDNTSLASTGEE